jgi:hypothetical protein
MSSTILMICHDKTLHTTTCAGNGKEYVEEGKEDEFIFRVTSVRSFPFVRQPIGKSDAGKTNKKPVPATLSPPFSIQHPKLLRLIFVKNKTP